ncbi:MAG: gliding motility-associated C-terminal domain-containing protein, partial [Chitinophagales bacterium]
GETYHLKFSIADEADHIYDSGVFFKAGSLEAGISADFVLPGAGFGTGATYCTSSSDPIPELVPGAEIGEFTSSPAGLAVDPATGAIDISASAPGTYTLTNTVIGLACGILDTVIASEEVVINALPVATFSYPGTPFCLDDTDPEPALSAGAEYGTFSATPSGLSITPSSGLVDLSSSLPGTYTVTNFIPAADGCPSVSATTTITISPSYNLVVNAEICDGTTYTLPDATSVTASGTYPVLLSTINSCDSLITTNLTVHPVYANSQSVSICDGDPFYLPDGAAVFTSGTYITTVSTIEGCDSVVTTDLTVLPILTSAYSVEICSGEFYTLPSGVIVSTDGTYTSTLTAATGCDSLVYTTVIVNPVYTVPVSANICADDFYTLPDGTLVNAPGIYSTTLLTVNGCDSVINTTLGNYPLYDFVFNPEMCEGSVYILPDGNSVAVNGTYINTFETIHGCDSVITTNLVVHPNPVISFPLDNIVCFEDGIISLSATPAGGVYSGTAVSGNQFIANTAGVGGPYAISYTYTDVYGCSDTVVQSISVDQNFANAFGDTTIVEGDFIHIWGNSGGDFTWTPANIVACPSCDITTASPVESGYITLTSVNDNGCIASDNIYVYVLPYPENAVFIPNAFTPNGDLLNDYLFAYSPNLVNIQVMEVFDRWGNIIYRRENLSPTDIALGWNGTINGKKANAGVYAYTMTVEYENGEVKIHAGNVTVLAQ